MIEFKKDNRIFHQDTAELSRSLIYQEKKNLNNITIRVCLDYHIFFFFYQSQENISMINIHSHAHIQIEFQSDSNLKISLSCASLHNISSLFFMLYVFTNSASIIVSFFLYVLCSLQTSKSCHHPVTELVLVLQNTKQSPSEINYLYIMPDGIPRSFRSDRRLR